VPPPSYWSNGAPQRRSRGLIHPKDSSPLHALDPRRAWPSFVRATPWHCPSPLTGSTQPRLRSRTGQSHRGNGSGGSPRRHSHDLHVGHVGWRISSRPDPHRDGRHGSYAPAPAAAGLEAVDTREITAHRTFVDFDDFWRTNLKSPSIGSIVTAMAFEDLETLRIRVRARLSADTLSRPNS
jgi:hypothetical protein